MKKLHTFFCACIAVICLSAFCPAYAAPPPVKNAASYSIDQPIVVAQSFCPTAAFVVSDSAPTAIPWQQQLTANVSYATVAPSIQMSADRNAAIVMSKQNLKMNDATGTTCAKPDIPANTTARLKTYDVNDLATYCNNSPPGCATATASGGKEVLFT
jgi:hypothetical protein